MKKGTEILFAAITLMIWVVVGCDRKTPDPKSALRIAGAHTLSSFDQPTPGERVAPAQAV